MSNSEYISIDQFAEMHQVPVEAVLNAIELGKLTANGHDEIEVELSAGYKFDLIGAYEYAQRKGVSSVAVYKRLDNKKILFTVDGDIMKIDWELYKDEVFRAPVYKFRGKNKLAS